MGVIPHTLRMETKPNPIIADIEAFCRQVGMAQTTFGRRAIGDGKFVARIRSGGRMWPETEQRVRDFMASFRALSDGEAE